MHALLFTSDDLIASYSRAEALADGALIDVSGSARARGFTVPVAVTAAAHAAVVEIPGTDAPWMLLNLLVCLRVALRDVRDEQRVTFPVRVSGRRHDLAAVLGPGDDGEPVITVMLASED